MSYSILLHSWSGADREQAVQKFSKVFRLALEEGESIMHGLDLGRVWKFEHPIGDNQAFTAVSALKKLGFEADLENFPTASPMGSMDSAEEPATALRKRFISGSALEHSLNFHGVGGDLFGIFAINFLKTTFTLGIYHFWAKTKVRQYLWSNFEFADDRFTYHGTGMELFKGMVKFIGMVLGGVIVLGIVQIYLGEWREVLMPLVYLLAIFSLPALMVGAWRYRLSRTSWRGIRFSFRGKRMSAVKLFAKGTILTGLTLGMYWPYFLINKENFWRGRSFFGDRTFSFSGKGGDIFSSYILAIFLTVLTAGLYWIWFQAKLQRYLWSHTHIEKAVFRFTATGWDYFKLIFINILIIVFTLGLGYAWAVVRQNKFLAKHVTLEGDLNLDQIVQEMKDSGAFGEEALDAFDIPIDIG